MHRTGIIGRSFTVTVLALLFVFHIQPAVSQSQVGVKTEADLNPNPQSTLLTPEAPIPLAADTQIPIYINGTTVNFNASFIVDIIINETRNQIIRMGLDNIHTPDVRLTLNNCTFAIGNGSIKGLANIQRTGDVIVTADPLTGSIKVRSAFSVVNVSSDYDIDIVTRDVNYTEGHVHGDFDNVTVYQVFRYDVITQTITLDEFELSVGKVTYSVTGLGDQAQQGSELITKIIAVTKGPALKIFNIAFRVAVNAALLVIRGALLAAG